MFSLIFGNWILLKFNCIEYSIFKNLKVICELVCKEVSKTSKICLEGVFLLDFMDFSSLWCLFIPSSIHNSLLGTEACVLDQCESDSLAEAKCLWDQEGRNTTCVLFPRELHYYYVIVPSGPFPKVFWSVHVFEANIYLYISIFCM